jgi:hypothetical protein
MFETAFCSSTGSLRANEQPSPQCSALISQSRFWRVTNSHENVEPLALAMTLATGVAFAQGSGGSGTGGTDTGAGPRRHQHRQGVS